MSSHHMLGSWATACGSTTSFIGTPEEVQRDSSVGIASKSTENVVLPRHTVSTDVVKILKILPQKHFRIS